MKPQWGPSPKEYGLNDKGERCETDDPKVAKMLVGKGGYLDWDVAARYGLTTEGEQPVSEAPDGAFAEVGNQPGPGNAGPLTTAATAGKKGARDLRVKRKATAPKK